jgi:Family of unknown function (DUF6489)
MKITVDVDCTPEEARRFMGLPDLTPVHDAYIVQMLDAVKSGGVSRDALEGMMKSWMPMGEAGLKLWTQLFDNVTGSKR